MPFELPFGRYGSMAFGGGVLSQENIKNTVVKSKAKYLYMGFELRNINDEL